MMGKHSSRVRLCKTKCESAILAPPCRCRLFRRLSQLLLAELLGACWAALQAAEPTQRDRCRVLTALRFGRGRPAHGHPLVLQVPQLVPGDAEPAGGAGG